MNENALENELINTFEANLAKLRFELSRNIYEIDVLDRERLQDCITLFNDRMTIFQHDFLRFIQRNNFSSAEKYDLELPSAGHFAATMTGVGSAGLSGLFMGTVPVATHGMLWWKTSLTSAALLGSFLGLSAVPVAVVTGGAVGCVVGLGVAKFSRPLRRQRVREGILEYFDTQAVPQLKAWAQAQISTVAATVEGSQHEQLLDE